jgi:putative SOS response-associated peptidase YedK
MCGRFGFIPDENFYKRFEIGNILDDFTPHYNIVPTMMVPVITKNSPKKVTLMRWGFIPPWVADLTKIKPQINARADGIEVKPFFRDSIMHHRCLVPCSHFFEWKALGKEKIPYCIRLKNKKAFAFAGIYSEIKDAEGLPYRTFAIITTQPNKMMEPIHNRMPVILVSKCEDTWLDEKEHLSTVLKLLSPYEDGKLEAFSVSKLVNNTNNDTPDVLAPFPYHPVSQTTLL